MPPEQMTLSARPMMRKRCEGSSCAMSLVVRVSGHTVGAFMMRQERLSRESETEGKGVYHSDAVGPLRRRRAMCESVSVMP